LSGVQAPLSHLWILSIHRRRASLRSALSVVSEPLQPLHRSMICDAVCLIVRSLRSRAHLSKAGLTSTHCKLSRGMLSGYQILPRTDNC
jgi:hypothetical protein